MCDTPLNTARVAHLADAIRQMSTLTALSIERALVVSEQVVQC